MSHDCNHDHPEQDVHHPEAVVAGGGDPGERQGSVDSETFDGEVNPEADVVTELPAEPPAPPRQQMMLRMEPSVVRALRDTFIAVADGKEVIIVEQSQ